MRGVNGEHLRAMASVRGAAIAILAAVWAAPALAASDTTLRLPSDSTGTPGGTLITTKAQPQF